MTEDQALGAIVGLAVGDALGTTLEFSRNPSPDRATWHTEMLGGGPFGLAPGGWTDDTSMALALMQAYLDAGDFSPQLIGQYFVNWFRKGAFSHTGDCFDIGNATREALDRIDLGHRGPSPFQGSTDPSRQETAGLCDWLPQWLQIAPIENRLFSNPPINLASHTQVKSACSMPSYWQKYSGTVTRSLMKSVISYCRMIHPGKFCSPVDMLKRPLPARCGLRAIRIRLKSV